MSGAELAAVRVTLRRELRRRPVSDDRPSTRNLRAALAELDALGDGPAWTAPVRERGPLPDRVVLDAIASVLSGNEWSADTAPEVAELIRLSGREVADLDESAV